MEDPLDKEKLPIILDVHLSLYLDKNVSVKWFPRRLSIYYSSKLMLHPLSDARWCTCWRSIDVYGGFFSFKKVVFRQIARSEVIV